MTRAAIQVRLQSLLYIVDLRSKFRKMIKTALSRVGVRTKNFHFDNVQEYSGNKKEPEHFRARLADKQRFFGFVMNRP
jgi:hypothetical protein